MSRPKKDYKRMSTSTVNANARIQRVAKMHFHYAICKKYGTHKDHTTYNNPANYR